MSRKPTRYEQEINRIKRQIKSLHKRGYTVQAFELPKTVKEARGITKQDIQKFAVTKEHTTGQLEQKYLSRRKKVQEIKKSRPYVYYDEDSGTYTSLTMKQAKERRKKQKEEKLKLRKVRSDKGQSRGQRHYKDAIGRKEEQLKRKLREEALENLLQQGIVPEKKERKKRKDAGKKRKREKRGVDEFDYVEKYYPKDEDIIIDNLIMLIERLENADTSWGLGKRGQIRRRTAEEIQESETARQSILDLINNEINNTSRNAVARRLDFRAKQGELNAIVDKMLHGYLDDVRPSYVLLASFIAESALSEEQTKYWSEIDNTLDDNYGEG